MECQDRETRTDPREEHRDAPRRESAPPIEREHETYAGVFEEDERREREREGEPEREQR